MKRGSWAIIIGVILIALSIGLTIFGAYRIIYIIKTDPFDDTPKYILKVFGLVGIIFLQIAGYGGGITLVVIGSIVRCKHGDDEPKKAVEQRVVQEPIKEVVDDSRFSFDEIRFEESKLIMRNIQVDMSDIKNVFMNRNEVRIKVGTSEYYILCKDTSDAISLVSKIKQYSK